MTSFQLKIIAIIAMTINHSANIIGQKGLFPNIPSSQSYMIIQVMNSVGKIAFPLFAFMISEGARKTKSMPKYIGRLALFSLISEPFFYFSHWRNSPTISGFFQNLLRHNFENVFFTLAIGAITIYVCQMLACNQVKHTGVWFLLTGAAASIIAAYIGCDYGMAGVLLIVALYFAREKYQKCIVILVWSACLYGFGQAYNPIGSVLRDFFFASSSCIFIWLYNGKRGRSMKWGFYVYYPIHLAVLTVIRSLVS